MSRFVAMLVVVGIAAGNAGPARAQPLFLDNGPYLGLACHGERYPCSRVGIAVWLARPARSVSAVVDGHVLELRTGRGSGLYRRALFWQGFFTDREAETMAGDMTRMVEVETFGVLTNGGRFVAHARSPVSSGYC